MANRKRKIPLQFYVNEKEQELIQRRMTAAGSKNLSAFLRKAATGKKSV